MITEFSRFGRCRGRQHYMTLRRLCSSEEERNRWMADKSGGSWKLILNKHMPAITPLLYGVVYDNGMELEKFTRWEGGPFPDYLDREFVILPGGISTGEGRAHC